VGGLAFGGYESVGPGMGAAPTVLMNNYLYIRPTSMISVDDMVYVTTSHVSIQAIVQADVVMGAKLIPLYNLDGDIGYMFRVGDTIKVLSYEGTVTGAGKDYITVFPDLPINIPIWSTLVLTSPFSRFPPVMLRRIDTFTADQPVNFDIPLDRRIDTGTDGYVGIYETRYVRAILRLEIQIDGTTSIYTPEPLGNSEWSAYVSPSIGVPDITSSTGPSYFRLVEFEDSNYSGAGNKIQVIEVWPPFSGTNISFRAEYVKELSHMKEDTDVSELQGKDTAIIAQASHLGFQSFGEADDASRWYTVYRDAMSNILHAQASVPKPSGPRGRASIAPRQSGRPWADPFVK
jgi:hypothetical protein